MSNLFLPLNDKKFLEVFQPEYGYEYDQKEFPTGFLYRIDTTSRFPSVAPIKLIYGKVDKVYLQLFSDFYHARGLSDDFLIDTTDLLVINPLLRINSVGKWIFNEAFSVDQDRFGANFVGLTFSVKQLI